MKSDRLSGIIFMLVAALCFGYVWRWPREAGMYPQIICGLIFVLGALLVLFPKGEEIKTPATILKICIENRMVLYVTLLTVVFILLIEHLGFFVVLPPFLIFGQLLMGERRPKSILLPTVLITALTYLVFVKLLMLQIPIGFWML